MFPHFRPPVTLSTVSWFCCRSRCRSVSSWCRVSLLPLELRRPSARTRSPLKLPSSQTFPVGNHGLKSPLHYPGSTLMTLYIYPRTQTGCKSSWWDTHAVDIWQFDCQITLKNVCYQPYWKTSAWLFICGHRHRAKKWRTVGQKVTYSGPKCDVRVAEKWRTGQNATLGRYNC